jgi:hypothetical protein
MLQHMMPGGINTSNGHPRWSRALTGDGLLLLRRPVLRFGEDITVISISLRQPPSLAHTHLCAKGLSCAHPHLRAKGPPCVHLHDPILLNE